MLWSTVPTLQYTALGAVCTYCCQRGTRHTYCMHSMQYFLLGSRCLSSPPPFSATVELTLIRSSCRGRGRPSILYAQLNYWCVLIMTIRSLIYIWLFVMCTHTLLQWPIIIYHVALRRFCAWNKVQYDPSTRGLIWLLSIYVAFFLTSLLDVDPWSCCMLIFGTH